MTTVEKRAEGKTVIVEASLTADESVKALVRIPASLKKRLEEQSQGAYGVALVALAEYAMERLEEEGKALVVRNRGYLEREE
ncbi:hypothetical protein [Pseudomarimonas arenosa]|uniref:CopG-like ribbon-helix-helix domain-containing protein n=1 Tax=Pseudomarimonas arenosa TaxID=2774145 RepID=A0AAW3ZSW7_9GAMM|nr:hypothetical protein [Pseudomarimonas arenosa]MBD8527286.1 hypothetical protein [Pseudomarimonas arenosa]